jgi:hypothetical protein
MQESTKLPKPIDRWLALLGIGIAVLLWLFPPRSTFGIGCALLVVFLALCHPVCRFWWIEDYLPRQIFGLLF